MASDALFQALAQAEGQPSKTLRAVKSAGQAGEDILGGYLQGRSIRAQQAEAALKPYEIYSNLSKNIGPDRASIVLKNAGLAVPDLNQGGPVQEPTPDQLTTQGEYGKNVLEAKNVAQGLNEKGPREAASVKSNLIQAGMSPQAADAWLSVNTNQGGKVENKNYEDLIKGINARNSGQRSNMYEGRMKQMQISDLPSRSNPNTTAGAAAQVQIAARQGKALIAKATSPQNLALASSDLARAVQRASPQAEVIGASSYAQSIPTILGRLNQVITSNPNSPDVPKLRKQLYDTFDELEKSSKPYIAQHLQTMEDSGFTLPNWQQIKARELGAELPNIPFDPGAGSGTADTGIPYKTATNGQGVKIRSSDNWATFEPVPQGQ